MRIAVCFVMAGIPMFLFCSRLLDVDGQQIPPPDAVVLMTPAQVYATGFTARWTTSTSEGFASYHLYCNDKPNPDEKSRFVWKTAYKNDTTLLISNLNPGIRWYAKVRAYNGFAWSESNEITAVTPGCTCGTFTGLRKGNMILIPGGCYYDQAGYSASVSHDFFMDTTEVTESEWFRILKPDSAVGSTKPIVRISWYQIILFCNQKSKKELKDTCYSYSKLLQTANSAIDSMEGLRCDITKNGYRLPTEDEWEYAYRCGTATDYYWGKNSTKKPSPTIMYPVTPADSNEIDLYEWWSHSNTSKMSHEVGLKRPNPWYLHDMGGNVAEMIWDVYDFRLQNIRLDYAGPLCSSSGNSDRVARGGMYSSRPEDLTAMARIAVLPSDTSLSYIGFRTVSTAP